MRYQCLRTKLFSKTFFIKNYVILILHYEWRYIGVRINSCRAQKTFFFVSFEFSLFIILENKYLKEITSICILIKGTVLGRALYGVNTFLASNQLPYPKYVFVDLFFLLWFSIVFYNNYGGDSKSLFFNILFFVRHLVAILVVTDDDSIGTLES